ncbi:succinylglutamate desuccinylase/aspartoacylase family protein [Maritalea sp.]|uniref:succinylglutamate desuccinylase/aspartoacylase family protein n=1 Tax=Maritalea sp. TaxID=2003361 RepID=UPI003EF81B64
MPKRAPFQLGTHAIEAGSRETVDLPVSVLSDHTPVTLSVHVVHGRLPGPTLFVSAAVHGDEVIGVEIVRRLLNSKKLSGLRGTLLAIPIVNSFGFMNHSRYLPDRRDLNRTFPGSAQGSLAGRLAYIFTQEILKKSDYGIDLHSAAVNRANLPQARVSHKSDKAKELAQAFGAPVTLLSPLREGSMRQVADGLETPMVLYEAGEGLRFDEHAAKVGVTGILRVMSHLGMLSAKSVKRPKVKPLLSSSSYWERAAAGGIMRTFKGNGEIVQEGSLLGIISDPFGEKEVEIKASYPGLIVGRTNLPVVNEGDGLFHIAKITHSDELAEVALGHLHSQMETEAEALFDEDEII